MSDILVKNKDIVVPGEELAKGMDFIPSLGTYREGESIFSSQLGVANVEGKFVKSIPLTGKYVPKIGDKIIGQVTNINFNGWSVDLGCAYQANLSLREIPEYVERGDPLERYYDYGDMVIAKVTNVTRSKIIDLSTKGPGFKKLSSGKIINITPSKVPRLIGKSGSMVSMINEMSGCNIIVGQNGRVWIKGEDIESEFLVTKAIQMIEQQGHKEGLTETIKEFLEKHPKKGGAK